MVDIKLRFSIIIIIALVLIVFLILYSSTTETNYDKLIKTIETKQSENEQLTSNVQPKSNKLFDIDLNYILQNPYICAHSLNITALIIVTSYFGNVETRSAMRRSHSREDLELLNLRRVFLLGESPNDKYTTQKSVENESKRFGDIVQGNFIEAYRNLTYKHVMGMQWAKDHCPRVKYVIKMDDDIVVNLERLPLMLESLKVPEGRDFIAGYILKNMKPIREPANKWYVTEEEYNPTYYPAFVSGWFYVTIPKTCNRLVSLSKSTKYLWIDDTYVTGILAQKLKIRHYDIGEYFTVHSEFLDCCINDIRSKHLNCDVLIGPNGGNNNLFYDFNVAMKLCNLNLCKPRSSPLNETCVAEKKFRLGKGDAFIENYKLH